MSSTNTEQRRAATTFVQIQDLNAEEFGDLVALEDPDAGALASVTWSQLKELSEALALALLDLGVEKGDAVGMHMVNRSEHAIVDAAALRSGATPVSFYYTLTEDQLAYVAKDCRTKVAFVDEALLPLWSNLRDKLDLAAVVVVGAVGSIDGCITFEELLQKGKDLLAEQGRERLDEIATQVKPDDTATIIYTSGTTGPPKGAVLTPRGPAVQRARLPRHPAGQGRQPASRQGAGTGRQRRRVRHPRRRPRGVLPPAGPHRRADLLLLHRAVRRGSHPLRARPHHDGRGPAAGPAAELPGGAAGLGEVPLRDPDQAAGRVGVEEGPGSARGRGGPPARAGAAGPAPAWSAAADPARALREDHLHQAARGRRPRPDGARAHRCRPDHQGPAGHLDRLRDHDQRGLRHDRDPRDHRLHPARGAARRHRRQADPRHRDPGGRRTASCWSRAPTSSAATSTARTPPRRRCRTAGCTPATWSRSPTRAT